MAQIQFGAIVVDARGKIGGQVFRKTATGHSLQRKANQSKNSRVGRTQQFQKLVGSLRQYSSLTALERQSLTDFALLHPLPNKFGVLRPLPARAMYQKLNANLLTANLGQLNISSLNSDLPAVSFTSVSYSSAKKALEFFSSASKFPFYVRVYVALTQGKANSVDVSKKRLMYVENVAKAGLSSIEFKDEENDKIVNFTGAVFIGLQIMNSSGWVGAVQWFNV